MDAIGPEQGVGEGEGHVGASEAGHIGQGEERAVRIIIQNKVLPPIGLTRNHQYSRAYRQHSDFRPRPQKRLKKTQKQATSIRCQYQIFDFDSHAKPTQIRLPFTSNKPFGLVHLSKTHSSLSRSSRHRKPSPAQILSQIIFHLHRRFKGHRVEVQEKFWEQANSIPFNH